jgi:NTE family protein
LGADRAGYYSTAPLERTLLDLVDFSILNGCHWLPARSAIPR